MSSTWPDPARTPLFSADALIAGRWQVLRLLARGGQGEVYEAKDLELGGRVALKTIRPEAAREAQHLERFRREIHLARKVTHPNVCRIFDLGLHHTRPGDAGVLFLTMEFLPGETLAERLSRQRMTPEEALPILRSILEALSAAHRAGVIHRDFKPQNVLLVEHPRGSQPPRTVVTDFGLARGASSEDSQSMSLTGEGVVGTPLYISPEQLEGLPLGPASDLYSFGIVLYQMLTGVLPFNGTTPMSVAMKRLQHLPEPPRKHVKDLPPAWERLILRCLQRDPAARPASAEALLQEIEVVASGTSKRQLQRGPILAGLAAGLLVGLAGWMLWNREPRLPDPEPGASRPAVAVLGFKNLTARPDSAWLSTALAEMLSTELAAGGKLRTISGEAVARMKLELALAEPDSYPPETLQQIRNNLGTGLVISGSYLLLERQEERRLRFDIRLQETEQGETLAAVTETGNEGELFDLVSRAGARLREKLGVGERSKLEADQVRAALPSDPTAARLYAEGLDKLRQFDRIGARETLEAAVAADPGSGLAHAALAEVWAGLGYGEKAREEARKAFELSAPLSQETRLAIEALYREVEGDWDQAVRLYQALQTYFPDDLNHGLHLAQAQINSGKARMALQTLESLRLLPLPLREDPRIDLTEGRAAQALAESSKQEQAARRAIEKGRARGAQLLVADAALDLGKALMLRDQLEPGLALIEEARGIYAAAGDQSGVGRTLVAVGLLLRKKGQLLEAKEKLEEARSLFESTGDPSGVSSALLALALVQLNIGQADEAVRTLEKAVDLCRETGDRRSLGYALQRLSRALSEVGATQDSNQKQLEAMEVFRQIGDKSGLSVSMFHYASNLLRLGDLAGARTQFEEAHVIDYELDNQGFIAWGAEGLGRVLVKQGELAEARRRFEEAIEIFRKTSESGGLARALVGHSEVLAAQGELEAAQKSRAEALAIWADVWDPAMVADVRMGGANHLLDQGRPQEALTEARAALEKLQEPDALLELKVRAHTVLGRALTALGQWAEARSVLALALAQSSQVDVLVIRITAVLTEARLQAALDRGVDLAAAVGRVQSVLAEARQAGLIGYELEARLTLAEIELAAGDPTVARTHLTAIRADAEARGYKLLATKADQWLSRAN